MHGVANKADFRGPLKSRQIAKQLRCVCEIQLNLDVTNLVTFVIYFVTLKFHYIEFADIMKCSSCEAFPANENVARIHGWCTVSVRA